MVLEYGINDLQDEGGHGDIVREEEWLRDVHTQGPRSSRILDCTEVRMNCEMQEGSLILLLAGCTTIAYARSPS